MFKPLTKGFMIWLFSLTIGTLLSVAHGEAVLTVSPPVTLAGDTVILSLEEVEGGESFSITLVGLNFEATLGRVIVPDDEQSVSQEFTISPDVTPGIYQIQAITEEGESLLAELSIEANLADTTVDKVVEPSAELMQLERSKPPMELALIVGGIVISAGLGFWLVIAPQGR